MSLDRLGNPDIARIFQGESVTGLSEWELLERYQFDRDELAFEALVVRHGPMVHGVCRRMLGNTTDADDAFQATFLVLVRKARQLGPRDAIGPWLYGVATRVALRVRSQSVRRRRVQQFTSAMDDATDPGEREDWELNEILDQELSRLPTKYRHPIVLCYLEGRSHQEAALQLKWPIGTVKGRLARARELLQSRLTRRGVAPAAGTLTFTLSLCTDSWASMHRSLLERTVRMALSSTFRRASTYVVSASIASIVEGVLTSMLLNTLKWTSMGILAGALALSGVAVMARQDAKHASAGPAIAIELTGNRPSEIAITKRAAAPDPLTVAKAESHSTNEVASIDLRKSLVKAALREWEEAFGQLSLLQAGAEPAYHASKRLMDAEAALANSPDETIASAQGHLIRVRELARSRGDSAQIRAYAAEAALWLAQAKTPETDKSKTKAASPHSGSPNERGKDPKSKMILAKLEEPISMSFAEDTPLEDVLKYIKQATTTATYSGIPIYVDPLGLQEAEKSMTSTVRNLDLEGVPLRRTLQLLLKQINLVYFVDDGMLCITSEDSAGPFPPSMHEPSPILQKTEQAERGELSLAEMKELLETLKVRQQIMNLSSGSPSEETHEVKQTEEVKQYREQVNLMLKEIRELIEALKVEKQTEKAPRAR